MSKQQFLTVAEAAQLLRVSTATVYRWVENGEIPHCRANKRKILFDEARLIEWIGPIARRCNEQG